VEFRVRLPFTFGGQLLSNLLGLAGVTGFALALGGITGNGWVAVLAGSLEAVGLAYVAHVNAGPAQVKPAVPTRSHVQVAERLGVPVHEVTDVRQTEHGHVARTADGAAYLVTPAGDVLRHSLPAQAS